MREGATASSSGRTATGSSRPESSPPEDPLHRLDRSCRPDLIRDYRGSTVRAEMRDFSLCRHEDVKFNGVPNELQHGWTGTGEGIDKGCPHLNEAGDQLRAAKWACKLWDHFVRPANGSTLTFSSLSQSWRSAFRSSSCGGRASGVDCRRNLGLAPIPDSRLPTPFFVLRGSRVGVDLVYSDPPLRTPHSLRNANASNPSESPSPRASLP